MITVFKSEERGIRQLDFPALEPGCWINVIAPKGDEVAALSSLLNIPADFITTALDPEETSHIESDDGILLIVINVGKSATEYEFDTVPLGIIITAHHIVTVSLEANDILPQGVVTMGGFSTFKRTRFLLQILYKTATAFLRYLNQINRRSNQIENNLRHAMKNEELYQLFDLEKSLTYFSAALRSNRVVIDRIMRLLQNPQMREIIKMREDDEDLLEDVQIEYNQAYEMVQMYSNVLSGMMDAFASIISNNLNIVMKFLASVTIIISVPTAVASFWGMNVGVPWSDMPYGFLFVLLLALATSALSTFWLWRKRML
ncbi:magnesium transporter CorA family protein [Aminithiophilus ramosus]|uniref:Magnesium transporter CorA family protein n=1 Tax=Aminithiophilus ramosus TaxID=3029084 RepID=A0A9Q7F0F4_9BACT|nr:magnesium transporter CorA family protein [Aminithiophilus ramosus]QTX33057.1 magnesium transporter CorA family protein [Aminithiophilus ramosus]